MIIKAVKKPVEIEAIKLEGNHDSIQEVLLFVGSEWLECNGIVLFATKNTWVNQGGIPIETLEGTMKASFGDYVIKGVNGEFYPCKPDVFHKTYDVKSEK